VSGFGAVSSGTSPFAAALAGKSGLSTFGSSSGKKPTITGLSGKTAKPFGAPESDEDEDDDEVVERSSADDEDTTEEDPAASKEEDSKRDKRFHEQDSKFWGYVFVCLGMKC
jgi:hypothetical protein